MILMSYTHITIPTGQFLGAQILMSPICIWLNPEIRSRRPDTIKYQNKQLMLNQNLLQ